MPVEPELRALMGQRVRFRPLTGTDREGGLTFGALGPELACRVAFPTARRQQGDRPETTTRSMSIIVDGKDAPLSLRVGSTAQVGYPDGTVHELRVTAVDEHWVDSIEGPGLMTMRPGRPKLNHVKVTVDEG